MLFGVSMSFTTQLDNMQLITIILNDPNKPVEMMEWLQNNPEVDVQKVLLDKNVFYIFYK